MKKALVVATVGGFIASFELNDIKLLQDIGYEVHGASDFTNILDERKKQDLKESGLIQHQISFARNPFSLANIMAYKRLKQLIREEQFDLIHCHTPMGGVLARLAAAKYRKYGTKVLYTAHGFHFFKGAPLKNWLIYYPVEKICAHMTDVLITINKEDYALARKKMKAGRIEYIPGVGVELEMFGNKSIDRVEKRKELGASVNDTILVSVGELNYNKNHQVIIKAISKIDNIHVKYWLCGRGEREESLHKLVDSLSLNNRIFFLGYRTDVPTILNAADIFCFPSRREGLGIAAIEAMASGLPLVTSNIHGINDYSVNNCSGFSCAPDDIDGFAKSIERLCRDLENRNLMGESNKDRAKEFDIQVVSLLMERIYKESSM